jgi:hypothetical protein
LIRSDHPEPVRPIRPVTGARRSGKPTVWEHDRISTGGDEGGAVTGEVTGDATGVPVDAAGRRPDAARLVAARPAISRLVAARLAAPWSAARVRWLPAAGLVALVVLIWVVYLRPVAPFDVEVFLRAGAAVGAGHDPYPPPGTAQVYSGFAFVYPYLVALPFVPLAALGGWGAGVFVAASLAALLAGARLAGARRPRTFALLLAASCTITGLQMGTLNAMLFLGLAVAWRFRDSPATVGAVTALVVYGKLFLAPVLLFLPLTRRWAAGGVAAGALAVLFGVGEAVSPVGMPTYTQMLSALAREEAPDGLSLTGLGMNVGLGLGASTWLARAVAVCLVAACWQGCRRSGDERLLFAGLVAAALVASPIVWSHYLVLLAVPLLIISDPDGVRRGAGRCGPDGGPSGPDTALPALPARAGLPALAAFTVGSWFVVTPHRSAPADLAGAGVVLTLLTWPALRAAARRLPRHAAGAGTADDETAASGAAGAAADAGRGAGGGRARALRVAAAGIAVAAVLVLGCLVLRSAAVSPTAAARVVGAYCTLVGVFAVVGWAGVRTGGRRRSHPVTAARPVPGV